MAGKRKVDTRSVDAKRRPKGLGGVARPDSAKAREREERALDLRKSGMSYRAIASEMGLATEGARQCVLRAMDRLEAVCTEKAEEVRRMELERLDAMLRGLWPRAEMGEEQAIDRVLKIQARRSALLGLDAPERKELTGKDGQPLPGLVVEFVRPKGQD